MQCEYHKCILFTQRTVSTVINIMSCLTVTYTEQLKLGRPHLQVQPELTNTKQRARVINDVTGVSC